MLFDLIEGSPCIDAGSPDLDGDGFQWMTDTDDQDLDGTRMDIGAFTYLGPDTIPPTMDIITLMVVNLLAQVRQLLSVELMMTG